MNANPAASILEELVETLEDGREGFQKAADKLEDDGHHELARKMAHYSDQRARLSAELREIALVDGVDVEDPYVRRHLGRELPGRRRGRRS